jgi:hypothetical protein
MSWATIWQAIQQLISKLRDKNKWKMSTDGKESGPITAVGVTQGGLRFEFDDNGTTRKLEAVAGNADHATIKVDEQVQPDARLVFSLKHQPLKPLIVVFEFKKVNVGGTNHRYRFDNPK